MEAFAKTLNKKTHVVVYCSNYRCTASGSVVKMLKRMGFESVWAYEGGIAEWYQRGLPVEGPCEKGYLQQVVEPGKHEIEGVSVISAQELKQKMEEMAA
jgi:3-mercaptopyruvate sulfurtransferase SseA